MCRVTFRHSVTCREYNCQSQYKYITREYVIHTLFSTPTLQAVALEAWTGSYRHVICVQGQTLTYWEHNCKVADSSDVWTECNKGEFTLWHTVPTCGARIAKRVNVLDWLSLRCAAIITLHVSNPVLCPYQYFGLGWYVSVAARAHAACGAVHVLVNYRSMPYKIIVSLQHGCDKQNSSQCGGLPVWSLICYC